MSQTNQNSANGKTRQVPQLSLMSYIEGSKTDQQKFIDQLYIGLKEYGFIILKDHPVAEDLFRKSYELLAQFYALPVEKKLNYFNPEGGGQRGYTPFGKEHAKNAPVKDLKEFWHVGREVSATSKLKKYHPDNVWPTEIPEFKNVFQTIYNELDQVGKTMLQALTHSLELPQHYFDEMTNEGSSILRLLHYPPIPEGVDPRCVRAAAHEDINLITILPAATASGLQLLDRDGQWLDVDGDFGSLIVDAGDMLSRITNEVIPSTTHRVINPVGANVSRFSMPFFMHPNPEAVLTCIPSCRGEKAMYSDITANEFLMQRLREIGLIKQ